jgi:hypothetical protein
MGHPQPKTLIQTDNLTAEGVINNKIQPKRTKAMDVRFHWLRDREAQGQLRIYWRPGKNNLADYFTKHHSPAHHKCEDTFFDQSQISSRSKTSATRTKTHSVNKQLNSYKGVLNFLTCTYVYTYGSHIGNS